MVLNSQHLCNMNQLQSTYTSPVAVPPFHDLSLSFPLSFPTFYNALLGLRCNIQTVAVSSVCAQLGQEKSSLITIPAFWSLSAVCCDKTLPNHFSFAGSNFSNDDRMLPIIFLAARLCFFGFEGMAVNCIKGLTMLTSNKINKHPYLVFTSYIQVAQFTNWCHIHDIVGCL